jgi:hypothetical protein
MDPHDPYDAYDAGSGRAHEAPGDGDAVDHLWNAAHEMLRAMRGLLDAADEFVESQRGSRPAAREAHEPREGRVRHIDIDLAPRAESRAPVDGDAGADAS